MNDPDESFPDELLEGLLTPLREATAPAAAQIANRLAVRQALAKHVRPRWWRRSIAVPIPVAIAATMALIVTLAALLRPLPAEWTAAKESHGTINILTSVHSSEEISVVNDPGRPPWQITQSYIRSLPAPAGAAGFIKSNAKENRNDS